MKHIAKLMMTVLSVLMFTTGIYAQSIDRKWSIGLLGGKTEYNGDLGNGMLDWQQPFYAFGEVSVNRFMTPSFDLGTVITYGGYGYRKNNAEKFGGRKTDASVVIKYKFYDGTLMPVDSRISPFIAAGVGFANFGGNIEQSDRVDFIFPVQAGAKLNITDFLALQYKITYNFTSSDKRDFRTGKEMDNYLAQSVGFVFIFGYPDDVDKDGVQDDKDQCLDTPYEVKVNDLGCPKDSDGDGVPDYQDKCPDVAGKTALEGCPDSDNDGVVDSEDRCPTTFGVASLNGCPDTDKDGITDAEDTCPTLPGTKEFKGCPDTDFDGIPDNVDGCPTIKGSLAMNGCPDKDNDGIADKDDKCPDVAGIKANKGCPEVKAEVIKVFEKALRGIQFESGKAIIKSSSFGILDAVVKVMKDNPEYGLEINGHTDDQGEDAMNMTLSQDRAFAVKAYISGKGIDELRMKSLGFGETQPVTENKTSFGRSQNRRVEFKVIF